MFKDDAAGIDNRVCESCLQSKPLTDYMKRGEKSGDGAYSHSICKACRRKATLKAYRESGKAGECFKRWREKPGSRKKANESSMQWQKNNPEKARAIQRRTRKKNKEKAHAITNKWRSSFALYESYGEILSPYEEIENRAGYVFVKCAYCGRWMQPTNKMVGSRVGAISGRIQGESRFYCSDNCKKACPTYNQKLYYKGQSVKSSSREVMPELRQLALSRDEYKCQDCGENGECDQLHVHHIKPVADDPIESADLDNVVTLCRICHTKAHNIPGCGFMDLSCKVLTRDLLLSKEFRFLSAEDLEQPVDEYVGKVYGKITVVERNFEHEKSRPSHGSRYYICKCECGGQKTIAIQKLKSGHTRSCGCEKHVKINPGEKYGMFTALEPTDRKVGTSQSRHYLCQCECGNVLPVSVSNLKSGKKYSCGCTKMPRKTTVNT